jgi:molybdate transport system permease protein
VSEFAVDLPVVWFTLRVAALAVLLLAPFGLALALLLARRRFLGKALLETLVSLPLVLPPVATGLLLLKFLGRRGPGGRAAHDLFGLDVVFTWRAVVVAMMVMSSRGIAAGLLLAFARALGEFGATILVAGNIPGRTTTIATAIYNDVQTGLDGRAYGLLTVSAALAFGAIFLSEVWLKRRTNA